VFVRGVPRFAIRPPCTSGDKGEPSASVLKDAHRVLALIEDERHLTAQKLYHDVKRRIEQCETPSVRETSPKRKHRLNLHRRKQPSPEELSKEKDVRDAKKLVESKEPELDKLEVRFSDVKVESRPEETVKEMAYQLLEPLPFRIDAEFFERRSRISTLTRTGPMRPLILELQLIIVARRTKA